MQKCSYLRHEISIHATLNSRWTGQNKKNTKTNSTATQALSRINSASDNIPNNLPLCMRAQVRKAVEEAGKLFICRHFGRRPAVYAYTIHLENEHSLILWNPALSHNFHYLPLQRYLEMPRAQIEFHFLHFMKLFNFTECSIVVWQFHSRTFLEMASLPKVISFQVEATKKILFRKHLLLPFLQKERFSYDPFFWRESFLPTKV